MHTNPVDFADNALVLGGLRDVWGTLEKADGTDEKEQEAGWCHSRWKDGQAYANRTRDRWGHNMKEVGIGQAGLCFQAARCLL